MIHIKLSEVQCACDFMTQVNQVFKLKARDDKISHVLYELTKVTGKHPICVLIKMIELTSSDTVV